MAPHLLGSIAEARRDHLQSMGAQENKGTTVCYHGLACKHKEPMKDLTSRSFLVLRLATAIDRTLRFMWPFGSF